MFASFSNPHLGEHIQGVRYFIVCLCFFALLGVSGCQATKPSLSPQASPNSIISYYDYLFFNPKGELLNLDSLPQEIVEADVILVGEWHTHSAIHRFQTDLLKQLFHQPHRPVALSMEQFSRDAQETIDRYLAGDIGEQILIQQANAWPNYQSDYRPLIELAKRENLSVIASNAPAPIVRCIGQIGLNYLDKLDNQQRAWIANQIDTQGSAYKDKFFASIHHGKSQHSKSHYSKSQHDYSQHQENQFAAQMAWDETMADSIVTYLAQHPRSQIMHIAGKFHVEQGLGTKAAILRRNPSLKVMVISPVAALTDTSTDYQLLVLPPPARYVQRNNAMQAYHTLVKRNGSPLCLP